MHNLTLTTAFLKNNNNYKKMFNKQKNNRTYSSSVLIISFKMRHGEWEAELEKSAPYVEPPGYDLAPDENLCVFF